MQCTKLQVQSINTGRFLSFWCNTSAMMVWYLLNTFNGSVGETAHSKNRILHTYCVKTLFLLSIPFLSKLRPGMVPLRPGISHSLFVIKFALHSLMYKVHHRRTGYRCLYYSGTRINEEDRRVNIPYLNVILFFSFFDYVSRVLL